MVSLFCVGAMEAKAYMLVGISSVVFNPEFNVITISGVCLDSIGGNWGGHEIELTGELAGYSTQSEYAGGAVDTFELTIPWDSRFIDHIETIRAFDYYNTLYNEDTFEYPSDL